MFLMTHRVRVFIIITTLLSKVIFNDMSFSFPVSATSQNLAQMNNSLDFLYSQTLWVNMIISSSLDGDSSDEGI